MSSTEYLKFIVQSTGTQEMTTIAVEDLARLHATVTDLQRELNKVRTDLALMVSEGILEYYDFSGIDTTLAKAKGTPPPQDET